MIDVIQIPALNDNYIYIITDKDKNITACLDPSAAKPVLDFIKKKKIKLDFIFNTHHHNDHVGGNLELKEITNCKIIGSESDHLRIPGIDILVKDKEKFKLGESEVIVNEIPGHTIGHICYYFQKDNSLFCGDTLFSFGCGRMFEGNAKQMWNSLKLIRSFPDETLIYCGHEYTEANITFALSIDPHDIDLKKKFDKIKKIRKNKGSTVPSLLAEEKKFNPFLKVDNVDYLKRIKVANGENWKVFSEIRSLKDNF